MITSTPSLEVTNACGRQLWMGSKFSESHEITYQTPKEIISLYSKNPEVRYHSYFNNKTNITSLNTIRIKWESYTKRLTQCHRFQKYINKIERIQKNCISKGSQKRFDVNANLTIPAEIEGHEAVGIRIQKTNLYACYNSPDTMVSN